jgi:hypothetical protein
MNSTNLGPLLANDPLLQLLIQRLQLTPLEFAILGLVSLPLVLFLWCHFGRTLRIHAHKGNPGGHSLAR